MSQIKIDGDAKGQIAGGNINNFHACPGPERCPYARDESDEQRRFEDNTGIVCCPGARAALLHLLNSGFDYKQLALAWRANSIWWDRKEDLLKVTISLWEFVLGWALAALGFLCFFAGSAALIVNGHKPLGVNQVLDSMMLIAILFAVPISARFLIKPNQLAKHAKPLLLEYYQKHSRA